MDSSEPPATIAVMPAHPPLNIDYWSLRYSSQQDDNSTYTDALREHTAPLDRAVALWDWKDLSRGVAAADIVDALTNTDLVALTERPPDEAVATLGNRLVEQGALANRTVVTPAFLLHLADSDPDHYSARFPIFDVRCWVAYVYLTRRRTGDQSLPRGATGSASKFGEFSDFFQRTLPDPEDGRRYEQALFHFGAYIASLPGDTISSVDAHLADLESALHESVSARDFALVEPDARGEKTL